MINDNLEEWQAKIEKIKLQLSELGEMRPGSISEQYNVCGRPNCKCKDPEQPKKHGPYYQLSYSHQGRSTTEFIKKELVSEVRQQLDNYRTFKRLTKEWVDLPVKIARQRKKEAGR
jgi:hypothetical protein